MHPRFLTALEHQDIRVSDNGSGSELTPAEAEHLALLGEARRGFCKRGHRAIRLAQYCGVVNLGDRVLEILPKVDEGAPPEECRGVLLRLLHEARGFPLFQHPSVGQHLRRASLLEVFIAAFLDAVAEIVRGGLLRQYREEEDDLRVVRGRIVASRQFAVHANRPDCVACRFDDLTADNMWNRFIKAGLRTVRPWIASVELDRRWVELMVALDEVDDAQVDVRALAHLVFDRHAARYRSAVNWVRWILALLSPALRAGQNMSPGLLFDMNTLFQSAVATLLQRYAGSGGGMRVQAQDTGNHLAVVVGSGGRRAFGLRPDLVARRGGFVVAIGDTKWKRLDVSRSGFLMPPSTDLYQMHAYAAAFQCEHLALIYPWHSGLTGSRETSFELPRFGTLEPVVSVVCVDLQDTPFRAVRGQAAPEFGVLLAERESSPKTTP